MSGAVTTAAAETSSQATETESDSETENDDAAAVVESPVGGAVEEFISHDETSTELDLSITSPTAFSHDEASFSAGLASVDELTAALYDSQYYLDNSMGHPPPVQQQEDETTASVQSLSELSMLSQTGSMMSTDGQSAALFDSTNYLDSSLGEVSGPPALRVAMQAGGGGVASSAEIPTAADNGSGANDNLVYGGQTLSNVQIAAKEPNTGAKQGGADGVGKRKDALFDSTHYLDDDGGEGSVSQMDESVGKQEGGADGVGKRKDALFDSTHYLESDEDDEFADSPKQAMEMSELSAAKQAMEMSELSAAKQAMEMSELSAAKQAMELSEFAAEKPSGQDRQAVSCAVGQQQLMEQFELSETRYLQLQADFDSVDVDSCGAVDAREVAFLLPSEGSELPSVQAAMR